MSLDAAVAAAWQVVLDAYAQYQEVKFARDSLPENRKTCACCAINIPPVKSTSVTQLVGPVDEERADLIFMCRPCAYSRTIGPTGLHMWCGCEAGRKLHQGH
jgi:hypothetical protein